MAPTYEAQLAAFKKKVVAAAIEMKEDHDYCNEALEEFLSKLGLEDQMPKREFVFSVDFTLYCETQDGDPKIGLDNKLEKTIIAALKSAFGSDYQEGSLCIQDWNEN